MPHNEEAYNETDGVITKSLKSFIKTSGRNSVIKLWATIYLRDYNKYGGQKFVERSQDEIRQFFRENNGITTEQIVRDLGYHFGTFKDAEEIIESLKVTRASSGSFGIDESEITVFYKADAEGKITFIKFEDYHNYINSGVENDESDYDISMRGFFLSFLEAFSKAYPVMPSNKVLCVDLYLVKKYWGNHTIGDVKFAFRRLVDEGWLECIGTNKNTGYIHDIQDFAISSYDEIPLLDRYGYQAAEYFSARKGIFNNEPTEFETKYGINLFRCPTMTQGDIYTFYTGNFGLICNGDMVIFEKTKSSTTKNPKYNIKRVTDVKKYVRHKDYYKPKKLNDPKYKGKDAGIDLPELWEEEIIKNNVIIHTEAELYNEACSAIYHRHKYNNFRGGSFAVQGINLGLEEFIYDDNTLWEEITTEGQYKNETEKERHKRLNTVYHINSRFGSAMNIKGMMVSEKCIKYAKAPINEVNNIKDEAPCLTKEKLDKMPVKQVLALDLLHSMTKSRLVWTNKMIKRNNKMFKEDVLGEYLHGNDGKRIQATEMENKDLFIDTHINSLVKAIIKGGSYNEDAQKSILKTLAIKDYEYKIQQLSDNYGIEVNLNQIKADYNKQRETYEIMIGNINSADSLNTLSYRLKVNVGKIAEDYNKATGKMLNIQSLKKETVSIIDEVVEENNKVIEQLNNKVKEEKELKQTLKETNKTAKQLKRALKKDLLKETMYKDYVSTKTTIEIDNVCNRLKELIDNILNNNTIKRFWYDTSKLEILLDYVINIENRKYEIVDGTSYSKDYGKLHNSFYKLVA